MMSEMANIKDIYLVLDGDEIDTEGLEETVMEGNLIRIRLRGHNNMFYEIIVLGKHKNVLLKLARIRQEDLLKQKLAVSKWQG